MHIHPDISPTPDDALRDARNRAAELLISGDPVAALALFREVLKMTPEDLPCRQKAAEILRLLGRTREAVIEYEATVRLSLKRGALLRAVDLCKDILQLEPDHAGARELLAELQAHRGLPRSPVSEKPREAATSDAATTDVALHAA
ncbi:tetratricopeptide repeat protein [Pyxidicoccus sp. 3LG]